MLPCKRIAVVGGESTGKSTLCKQLAAYFETQWVPEVARTYLEQLNRPYSETDLWHIAKGQLKLEDELLCSARQFLFCDTDLLVIQVWSEFAYGQVHPDVLAWINTRRYDAYLITSPDLPWQPDPLREHPEQHLREFFFRRYIELVASRGVPWFIVQGKEEERFQGARQFLESNFLP